MGLMTATKREPLVGSYLRSLIVFLPLVREFMLSLLSFVVDNMEKFPNNLDIHSVSTKIQI
jgi:hypothetical protein